MKWKDITGTSPKLGVYEIHLRLSETVKQTIIIWVGKTYGSHFQRPEEKVRSHTLQMNAYRSEKVLSKWKVVSNLQIGYVCARLLKSGDQDIQRLAKCLQEIYGNYHRNHNRPSVDGKHWHIEPIPEWYYQDTMKPILEFCKGKSLNDLIIMLYTKYPKIQENSLTND